ncbi:MAG TPA: hypothetical protein VMF88_02405, partial [Bacteroidota bacterium]|nr:hypothetical protein [Bacteroidota bacterium]
MSKVITTMLFFFVLGTAYSDTPLHSILTGSVKGTTLPNHTYVILDSISVNVGDTLTVSAGDTLIMANPLGWIHVLGTFICDGTKASPNLIT